MQAEHILSSTHQGSPFFFNGAQEISSLTEAKHQNPFRCALLRSRALALLQHVAAS